VHPTLWAGRPTALDPNRIRVRDRTVRPNPDAAVEDMGHSHRTASPQDLPIQPYP
jgi:hypothetical protein